MRRSALIPALAVLMAVAGPVSAQTSSENRMLYDRIERLERDLQTLQVQLARGGQVPAPAQPLSPGMNSMLGDRVDQLEEQLRQLTGKLEESNFKSAQTAKTLEKMQADIDLRFKELQQSPAQPGGQTPQLTAPGPGGNSAGDTTQPAPGPQNLGTVPDDKAKKPAAAATDPQGMYDEAFGQAQKGNYTAAEEGFRALLAKYPNHALAGNAQYWLGDIAFNAKKDYAESAKIFAEGYTKFPKHGKAPDMLYKLGASFAALDRKADACKTFTALFERHPDMPDRIRRAATADKQKLGCK